MNQPRQTAMQAKGFAVEADKHTRARAQHGARAAFDSAYANTSSQERVSVLRPFVLRSERRFVARVYGVRLDHSGVS